METGKRLRAIFISDIHLGSRACQAELLIDFLREYDAATIYLVGDIVDFWKLKSGSYWPQSHNDVVQKLLRKVRKGTHVILIPGNHDEALRGYCGMQFGGIDVVDEAVHQTADGRRILVMHGDGFDGIVHMAKSLAFLGDRVYVASRWANGVVNSCRRLCGLSTWSLSGYLKQHVKSAVRFIHNFETAVAQEARNRSFDGVICGHIHHAADRDIHGINYLNCGDWVESCTALVEDHTGQFHLVRWRDVESKPDELAASSVHIPAAA